MEILNINTINKSLYKDYNPYNQAEAKMGRSAETIYYAITEKTRRNTFTIAQNMVSDDSRIYRFASKKPSWNHSDTYYGNPPKSRL